MTRYLTDPTIRGRVQRALMVPDEGKPGNCFDCKGSGNRENLQRRRVPCPTCNGSGRLESLSIAQVSGAAAVTVTKTIDALRDLEADGHVERVPDSTTPELWRAVRRAS